MPFVKLDCGVLDSSLWVDRVSRELFITALLMAVPWELTEPMEQIEIGSLANTGFVVPPGWYGFVQAAAPGLIRRALVDDMESGMEGLKRLSSPDPLSRSQEYEGRRIARVDGGFIILNFAKYRDRDYTAADRARRYRERKRVTRDVNTDTRDITQAEADIEAEADKKKNASALPEWLDGASWTAWEIYRKEIGKKLTKSTITRQLNFLNSHRADHAAIINQSITSGWTGLFPLKASHENSKRTDNSAPSRVRRANEKYLKAG